MSSSFYSGSGLTNNEQDAIEGAKNAAEAARDAAQEAQTAAETAETNAETAAASVTTGVATATTKASEASDSADTASTKANEAAASASASSTSASAASTSASSASTSASASAASASAASTDADDAASAKTGAEAAQAAAEAALADFEGVYLGALASDPTVDANGDAVNEGDLYFNTTDNELLVYDGTDWVTSGITTVATTSADGLMSSSDKSKLDGVEANADVTDAANVDPLVDTHLNTSGASNGQYLEWNGTDYQWSSVDLSTKMDVSGGTFSGGVDVTGTVTADALNVESTTPSIRLVETDTTDVNTRFRSNAGSLFVQTSNDANNSNTTRLSISHNSGDISFYDTSGNAKFFWDASAERLGIGTTSPATALDVNGDVSVASGDKLIFGSNGSAYITGEDGGPDSVEIYTDGSNRLTVDQYGILVANGLPFSYQNAAGTFYTNLQATDPTADRTITLPDRTGTLLLSDLGDSQTINFQDDITFEDTLNSSFASSDFYIKSNNDGVSGVHCILWKNSDSPAVDDEIGRLRFYGTDSAGAGLQAPYTGIASYIDSFDLSASRHGHIEMQVEIAGAVPVGGSTGTFTSASFHYDKTKIDAGKLQIGEDGSSTSFTTDATSDQTITLPDQTGTAMLWQSAWPDDPASDNIAIGNNTLSSVTAATTMVAIGSNALSSAAGSGSNTAVGYNALAAYTSNSSAAFGSDALVNATTGSSNTAMGRIAGRDLTTGAYNTAVGNAAMRDNTTDSYTTSVGYWSGGGDFLTGGTYVGALAGNLDSSSKDYQVAIGYAAGNDNSGDTSTAVGALSMSDGNHYRSTAVGYDALGRASTSSPYYNVAVGYASNSLMYSGDYAVTVGYNTQAIFSESIAIGGNADATGTSSISIGYLAGASYNTSNYSSYCVLIGQEAGYDMDGGDYCTFVGYQAGYAGGTGGYNTGIGRNALDQLTTGQRNTSLGASSLSTVTSGDDNVGLGSAAGNAVTSGSNNVLIGRLAGKSQGGVTTNELTTGSNVVCLGFESMPSSSTATNEITLGNANIATLRCNVQTISSLSDERDKTAIADIPYGLDFINDMRPVQFTWNRRDGSLGAKPDIGFIAQELHDVELDHSSSSRTRLVNWANPEKLEADYVRSYPILVKAVQELSAKCDALEARIATLEGN
jgi:hypothetical protein